MSRDIVQLKLENGRRITVLMTQYFGECNKEQVIKTPFVFEDVLGSSPKISV